MNISKAAIATSEQELKSVYDIRRTVFVQEQGVSEEEEYDEYEEASAHVLVYYEGKPVGTGRIRVLDSKAKLERICVLPEYRNYGFGREVMAALEEVARSKGLSQAKLHAQTQAQDFYTKLGYEQVSDLFLEADIPHVAMVKPL
ncbi:GNAT family N-acetyltransferase [Paenibacillus mendelii]|uniref:GNAT family N-acetyltransferase n=1 Tax=Paenibacillus mendelii TaxID=206163 RepID=A0ABV6JFY9_9BACL|nr:GNAT family N-acetyltransferase [Paenibacillus mendelii]MCQ6557708.1 GNAT family N-acetyltransferase [Paenibacillus mendelii]